MPEQREGGIKMNAFKRLNILEAFKILKDNPRWSAVNLKNNSVYKYHIVTQEAYDKQIKWYLENSIDPRQRNLAKPGQELLSTESNPYRRTLDFLAEKRWKDHITLAELEEFNWVIVEAESLDFPEVLRELCAENKVTVVYPESIARCKYHRTDGNGKREVIHAIEGLAKHIEGRGFDRHDILAGYYFKGEIE